MVRPRQRILAIDPGDIQSAYVIWDGAQLHDAGIYENERVLVRIPMLTVDQMVIEMIESYGKPVGRTIFETVLWIGRFVQLAESIKLPVHLLPRREVKLHICLDPRVKDSNIAQALRDRFGEKPTKAKPNPVYNGIRIRKDEWQAWALAVTWAGQQQLEQKAGKERSCT